MCLWLENRKKQATDDRVGYIYIVYTQVITVLLYQNLQLTHVCYFSHSRSIYSTCTTHYRGNSNGFTLPCHSPSSHVYCSIYLVKTKYGHYPAFTIPEKWKLTIINLNIQHWSPLHWAPIRLRARIRALHRRTRDMITAVHVITIEMTWFNLHP